MEIEADNEYDKKREFEKEEERSDAKGMNSENEITENKKKFKKVEEEKTDEKNLD